MAEIDIQTAVIAQNASLSAQVDIGYKSLVGLVIPSGWVAAAGGLTLQASPDGGITWYEVTTAAGSAFALAYTAGGAAYIATDPNTLRGIYSYKIRSGTVGAPVNQTAAGGVTLQLVTRLAM